VARSEHFYMGSVEHKFPPLYHGSSQEMKPGDTIKPGSEGVAFATSHRDQAGMFAVHRAGNTVDNQLGEPKAKWRQQAMFHPIYSVEPAEDTEAGTKGHPEYHTSKTGFKVKGVDSYVSEGQQFSPSPSSVARAKERKERYLKQREEDPL